jgi:hypothetical protein
MDGLSGDSGGFSAGEDSSGLPGGIGAADPVSHGGDHEGEGEAEAEQGRQNQRSLGGDEAALPRFRSCALAMSDVSVMARLYTRTSATRELSAAHRHS